MNALRLRPKAPFRASFRQPQQLAQRAGVQLKERTELTHNKVGPAQRESILEAGIALQKAGVIGGSVDVKKSVDDLIDDRYVTAAN